MSEVAASGCPDTEAADPVQDVANEDDGRADLMANTPGTVLRQAREACGKSIADVVQVIRFSSRQIEALERDDYASLPGSTAVRGLVRNYAKFLKLDATPLLEQLDPAVPVPEADVRPPANMGEAEPPTITERMSPAFLVIGFALLLLAAAGYWYATGPGDGVAGAARGRTEASGVAKPDSIAAPSAVPVVQPASTVVADSVPAAAGDSVGQPPFAGLRVEFDGLSWIEIRDATQKVVFSGEYPAGTRQNVEGRAPFQVWIGRASSVRVFMGERSIDLKPHTREDVARFGVE